MQQEKNIYQKLLMRKIKFQKMEEGKINIQPLGQVFISFII